MAIDSNREKLISLTEAAKLLPKRRQGKRPHVTCLYRWTTHGCRGVVLESIQVGATRCTSMEALDRFFQSLSTGSRQVPWRRSKVAREKAIQAATKYLEENGA